MDYNKSLETFEDAYIEMSTFEDGEDELFLIGELGHDGYLDILGLSEEVGERDLMKLHSMVQEYGMEEVALNFFSINLEDD